MQPTFSQPQEYIITSTQDINLFLAGVGSGKTHLGGFISGYYILKFPNCFGFIGANTYQQLTTSTLYRVREVWAELFHWRDGIDYVVGIKPPKNFNTENHNFDSYDSIISFKNGAVVFKGSLDNAKMHDGKEFGWAILDETKDSREQDVKDVILTRLRKQGIFIDSTSQLTTNPTSATNAPNRAYNPLYILTSPAKVQWINEWFEFDSMQTEIQQLIYSKTQFFIKEWKDKCVVISSTYHNEANLPVGYIQRILDNQTEEGAKRLIYGNPFVRAGGEFYSGFNRMKHVRKVEYLEGLPIHISFDQNVVPYVTATLYQIEQLDGGKQRIRQFDEICLSNPNNRTEKLCLEFIRRWGSRCKDGLYYYGDPSGKKSDTRSNEHDYKIVERILRRYLNNRSNRVPFVHPRVIKRKDFINNCLEMVYPELDIIIGDHCKHSITDFEFLKEDINGKKLKETAKDDSGRTYEKYGHTSDTFDYFITQAFPALYNRHFK